MAKQNFLQKLSNISLGLFLLISQLWIIANVPNWVGKDDFRTLILTYIVLFIYLFMYIYMYAVPDLRSRFFNVRLVDFAPKMLFWFFATYIGLTFVGSSFVQAGFFRGYVEMTAIIFWAIIIHAFIRAVVEETFFRYYLQNNLGMVGANIVFALFHFAIKGGHIPSLFVMFGIGMFWSWLQNRYSPHDASANIGSHAGYDSALDFLQQASGLTV